MLDHRPPFHPTVLPTGRTWDGSRLLMTVRTITHQRTISALHRVAAGLPAQQAQMGQDHPEKKQGPPFAGTNRGTCTAPNLREQNQEGR